MQSTSSTREHRSKKRFQPTIATYLLRRDDFDDHNDRRSLDPRTQSGQHHYVKTTQQRRDSLAPSLPGQVQTDLLSVGMRVRKSVPEGYKTQKVSTLPSIQTTLVKPTMSSLEVRPPREPVPDDFVHQRELLPFCGLHKIGGYAEQPTTNIHLYGGLDSTGLRATNHFPLPAEAFTQPFSSQGSADAGYFTSSQRPPNLLNPSKRSWQDEDEKPLNTNFFFSIPVKGLSAEVDEAPVSPLSETPPQSINMLPTVRQFAQPKSRRAGQQTMIGDEDMDMDMDYENTTQVEGRVAAGSASDFEEADFLGREVDMGGI